MVDLQFPIYVPSKGRADQQKMTGAMFDTAAVPFHFVVEPQDEDAYVDAWGADRVLLLPENDQGLVYARNWIKDYSTRSGEPRHWQFDDDVARMIRVHKGYRIPVDASMALQVLEDFALRYTNVALASFNYEKFVPVTGDWGGKFPPFYLNTRCYTCFLIDNAIPNRWRGRYNEDTDMTLQVLADGMCSVLLNAFCIRTPATMTQSGGQTAIYEGDGRLHMAKEMERRWPGVVEVKRKFGRPQHHVKGLWQKFDTALIPADDPPPPRKYNLTLSAVAEVQSPRLRQFLKDNT